MWIPGYLFYTLGYNPILVYLSCRSDCSSFSLWELSWLAPVSVDISLPSSAFVVIIAVSLWKYELWFLSLENGCNRVAKEAVTKQVIFGVKI